MTFNIRDHVEFDSKGRAQCPACRQDGKNGKNLSLIPFGDGAYKCHRGCQTQAIRDALGRPKAAAIAPSASPPTKPITVPTDTVIENHRLLMEQSTKAMQWLLNRGFSNSMIKHFTLGVGRSKCGKIWLPAITIPIPDNNDSGGWYQKKRVAPWLSESEHPPEYRRWSQYGIPSRVWWTHPPNENTFIALACEGEWDAMQIGWLLANSHLGREIAAFTFTSGAGNVPKDLSDLDGIDEIITLYDLDKAGQTGAEKLHARIPDRVKIATVPHHGQAPEGYDLSDAIQAGFTLADIFEAAKQATVPTAVEQQKKENPLRERLVSNADLIARAPDHTEWLVDDLLTEDELFVLAAPPRGGKSFFCLTLAKAIATGGRFLERPVSKGTVIYVNCEDSEGKIKQREQAMDWPEDVPVWWMDKFKLGELPHLIEIADELPDLRLIVLDTLSRVRDDTNKESSAELGRVLEPLQEFAKKRRVCVLITHHTGKLGSETETAADPFDALRGSSAIRATARGVILIVPGDQCYRLLSENGHTEKLDLKIRPHPQTCEWQLLGRWEPRVDADVRTQVLDHLNLVGQATVSEIATELQLNARTVGNALSKLRSEDLITRVGGKGRQPATYVRSFTLLHSQKQASEAYNAEGESLSPLLHSNNLSGTSAKKVSNEEKSEQKIAHFSAGTPSIDNQVKQSCEPYPASDPCFTSGPEAVKQSEASCTPQLSVGDRVLYNGSDHLLQQMFGRKHLEVLSLQENHEGWWVTISHPSLQYPQTFSLSDVKRLEAQIKLI
jgi:DNA-binding transcriptional regulator YhcF (GntR family)